MTIEDEHHLRGIIVVLQRQILELKASAQASRQIFQKLSTEMPEESSKILNQYDDLYRSALQELMVTVENCTNPSFAAELDEGRPPFSQNDTPPPK
jgi:hypothetical protein